MATMVASRFAVLSIDDDDDTSSKNKLSKNSKKVKSDSKSSGSQQKSTDAKKKKNKKKADSTNLTTNGVAKAQQKSINEAAKSFNNATTSIPTNQPPSKKTMSKEQWEEWKKKDQEFVTDSYEQDLHEAMLLSKLDYEEAKKHYRKLTSGQEVIELGGKGVRKRSKPQTMSLEQFNNPLVESQEPEVEEDLQAETDRLFFEQVMKDAKLAFVQEQQSEIKRAREPYIPDAVTLAQFQDNLEKRDMENVALKQEVLKLKAELQDVRTRNTQLCVIIAQGELKDKVGVLVEVERLQAVREELSNEVQRLHAELEQERSKVRALTQADNKKIKGKEKGKKKTASESDP